jgi:uncharacterized integral membrane protein
MHMAENEAKKTDPADPFTSKDVNWRLIGFIAAVVLGVIFFFQNDQTAELNFLFFSTESKTRWLVIVCIAVGVVADRLFTMWWHKRKERQAREKAAREDLK